MPRPTPRSAFAILLTAQAALALLNPAVPPPSSVQQRRAVLSGAGAVLSAALLGGAPLAALAYDALPTSSVNFAEAEAMRKVRRPRTSEPCQAASSRARPPARPQEREEVVKKSTAVLVPYVKKIEAATDAAAFEVAADEFALYIIGTGKIAEGVRMKDLAARIRAKYDSLPVLAYRCPKGQEKRDGEACYTPGVNAELAFAGLMKQMRKYSMIQLGDFRKVEFAQF